MGLEFQPHNLVLRSLACTMGEKEKGRRSELDIDMALTNHPIRLIFASGIAG